MSDILLVDDDQINSKVFSKRLEKRGYRVFYVSSGEECLEFIKKNSNVIVLLDVVMPNMNGIEVLTTLRQEYPETKLPIIMITAKDDTEMVCQCFQIGANDYLTKPVNMDIGIARIETQQKLKSLNENALKSKQLETINAMIATYNHEINNPLTIAIGNLSKKFEDLDELKIKKSMDALFRIKDIVKKIDEVASEEIQEEVYVEDTKMIKLK